MDDDYIMPFSDEPGLGHIAEGGEFFAIDDDGTIDPDQPETIH